VRVWGEGVKTEVLGDWKREWEERGGHGDRRVGILHLVDMGRGGATPLRGGGDGLLGGGSSEAGFLNARSAFGMTGYYFFGEFEGTEDPAFADSEWGGTERKAVPRCARDDIYFLELEKVGRSKVRPVHEPKMPGLKARRY
jgi:hypothetical protein